RLIDHALRLGEADQGFLVAREDGRLRLLTARNQRQLWIRESEAHFSRSIIEQAIESGRVVQRSPAGITMTKHTLPSLRMSRTKCLLAVPFRRPSGLSGAIYLDRTEHESAFTFIQMLLVEALAEQAAVSLERARMTRDLQVQTEQISYLNRKLEAALERKDRD